MRTESELEGIEDGPKLPLGTREELGCTLFWMPWYQGARLSADLGRLADGVPQPHLEAARIEAASPAALLWGQPLTDQEQALHTWPGIALWWSSRSNAGWLRRSLLCLQLSRCPGHLGFGTNLTNLHEPNPAVM